MFNPQQEAMIDTSPHVTAYVHIHKPRLVFQAPLVTHYTRDNGITGLGVGSPTVGSLASVRPEMLVQININGHGDGGKQRIRGTAPNTLWVGRTGHGNVSGRLTVNRGGVVQVYEDYRPFIKAPYIDPETYEQFKDDTPFLNDNIAQPPVANIGSDRLIITDALTADVTFNAYGDIPSFPVREGATLTTFAWEAVDGEVVSGSMSSSTVTIRFPHGERWVYLTVTDSNGISTTVQRLVVVQSKTECIPATINTYVVEPDKTSIGLTIDSAFITPDIQTEAKVLVAELENYELPMLGYTERFSGWIANETSQLQDASSQQVDFALQLMSIGGFLQSAYLFPQSLNLDSGLGGWYDLANPNIGRLLHHVIYWHSNVLAIADFHISNLSIYYPFRAWTTSGGTVYDAVNMLSEAFAHQLTTDARNTIRVVVNPHIAPTDAQVIDYIPSRRPQGIVTTFTPSRFTDFSVEARGEPNAYWLNVVAQLATTGFDDVVSCIAPANAPSRGQTGAKIDNWLVYNQSELNWWASNYFEVFHSPSVGVLRFSTLNPSLIVEPALRLFVGVQLPQQIRDRYNIRADSRWTIENISFSWTSIGKVASYTLRMEELANHPATTTYQTEEGTTNQTWDGLDPYDTIVIPPYTPPVTPVVPPDDPPVPPRNGNVVMSWNERGVWLTYQYKIASSPEWLEVTPALVEDEVVLTAGFGKGTQAYVVAYSGVRDASRVYYNANVFSTLSTWTGGDYAEGKLDVLRPAPQPDTVYLAGQGTPPPVDVEWEQVFDFTIDEQGWTINQNTPTGALTYVAGVGFKFERIAGGTQTRIFYDRMGAPFINTDSTVIHLEVFVKDRSTSANSIIRLSLLGNGNGKEVTLPAGTGDASMVNSTPVNVTSPNIFITGFLNTLSVGSEYIIEKVVCKGTGFNPFAIEADYMQVFDFTQGTQGFNVDSYATGQTLEYVAGQGFRHTMTTNASRSATATKSYPLIPSGDIFITKIRFDYDRDLNAVRGASINTGFGGNIDLTVPLGTGSGFIETSGWITRRDLDRLSIVFNHQWGASIPNPTGYWVTVTKLTIWGISKTGMGNPFAPPAQALLGYSDDNGQTLTLHELGTPPTLGLIGLDTVTIGDRAYIGIDGEILQAENDDIPTPYATLPADLGVAGASIHVPRRKFDNTDNAVDDPDMLVASPVLTNSDEALWEITNDGSTLTDITPTIGGDYGVVESPNSITMSWQTSAKRAIIVRGDGDKHLMVWDGATWLDRGVVDDTADSIRMRKQDTLARELYFTEADVCKYSPDYGVTILDRVPPDEDMVGIAVYG